MESLTFSNDDPSKNVEINTFFFYRKSVMHAIRLDDYDKNDNVVR